MVHQHPNAPSLTRVLTDIVVGSQRAFKARDDLNYQMRLQELELQYQYAISGQADTLPAFSEVDIPFDFPLHYAPGQRDSDLENPHFKFGAECSADVLVTGHVKLWDRDDSTGAVIGATVKIAVLASGPTVFTGVAHYTFQGYGSLSEEDPTDS